MCVGFCCVCMLFMYRQSSHIKHLRRAVVTIVNFRLQRGSQHRGKSSLNSFHLVGQVWHLQGQSTEASVYYSLRQITDGEAGGINRAFIEQLRILFCLSKMAVRHCETRPNNSQFSGLLIKDSLNRTAWKISHNGTAVTTHGHIFSGRDRWQVNLEFTS